jgi:hypothetical protein
MGRFETNWLASDEQFTGLSGQWIDCIHGRRCRGQSYSTWIRPPARPVVIRKALLTTANSPAPPSNGLRCLPATFTRQTAGRSCSNRSWPATGSATSATTSAPMPPLPTARLRLVHDPAADKPHHAGQDHLFAREPRWAPADHGPVSLRRLQLQAASWTMPRGVAANVECTPESLSFIQRSASSSPSVTLSARETRSCGPGCRTARSPPMRCVFSCMHWLTISPTSCGRWRCLEAAAQ